MAAALRYQPRRKPLARISRYDSPYRTALVKIGRPAVPAMIANIGQSDERTVFEPSLGVLNRVLGGKRRMLELLGKLQERATDPDVRRRLERTTAWAENYFVEDDEPLY